MTKSDMKEHMATTEPTVVQPLPKTRIVAKCRIVHGVMNDGVLSTMEILPGGELPFDPRDPKQAKEHGATGLVEGEHWELVH